MKPQSQPRRRPQPLESYRTEGVDAPLPRQLSPHDASADLAADLAGISPETVFILDETLANCTSAADATVKRRGTAWQKYHCAAHRPISAHGASHVSAVQSPASSAPSSLARSERCALIQDAKCRTERELGVELGTKGEGLPGSAPLQRLTFVEMRRQAQALQKPALASVAACPSQSEHIAVQGGHGRRPLAEWVLDALAETRRELPIAEP